METALQSISNFGVAVVGLVALAFVVWYFIQDIKAQRDRAQALAESAVTAFDRLADQLGVQPVVRPSRPPVRKDDKS